MNITETVLHYVVPPMLGLLGGAIGSLVAPWSQWGVEKKRMLLQSRRIFILEARNAVTEHEDMHGFIQTDIYTQLRPHLSQKTIDLLSQPPNHISIAVGSGKINNYKPLIREDISRLESKWGLV